MKRPSRPSSPSSRPPAAGEAKRQGTVRVREEARASPSRTPARAATNRRLQLGIIRHQKAESELRKNGRHYVRLLRESLLLQKGLRQLTHQVLTSQEDERRHISDELHNQIAQTLFGINVRLLALKQEALSNTRELECSIASAQKLVEASVDIVHQFARELRPALLDDLGLIPALHALLGDFTARTGILAHLTACADITQLDPDRRTVLFRVAQEALTTIEHHANAGHVHVLLRTTSAGFAMAVHDDGSPMPVRGRTPLPGDRRLGPVGMRERLEMVGGSLEVGPAAGRGNRIVALVPCPRPGRRADGSAAA